MADQTTPPKDLEVRLTELENAVQALTQGVQPAVGATTQSQFICAPCQQCLVCFQCFQCTVCRPICDLCRPICQVCRPICAECNGCLPM